MTLAGRTLTRQCPLKSDHWFNLGTNNYGGFYVSVILIHWHHVGIQWILLSFFPWFFLSSWKHSLTRNKLWFDQSIKVFSSIFICATIFGEKVHRVVNCMPSCILVSWYSSEKYRSEYEWSSLVMFFQSGRGEELEVWRADFMIVPSECQRIKLKAKPLKIEQPFWQI